MATTVSNVTLLLQAMLQAKLGSGHAHPLPLLDGPCSLEPYEHDQCLHGPVKDASFVRPRRNALACERWLWPNAVIPYDNRIEDDLIAADLYTAMKRIEAISCVRFRPFHSSDTKHLTIEQSLPVAGERCRATAGAQQRSPQLRLSSVCTQGQMLHELFHVLGFAHEHARPDRDQYIRVECRNVARNLTQNFRRLKANTVQLFDTPYDFYSIMHYPLNHFSANGQPTIVPLSESLDVGRIGQMKKLSWSDIYRLNRLYKC